jgi:predicted O-methyltransferase YrrM
MDISKRWEKAKGPALDLYDLAFLFNVGYDNRAIIRMDFAEACLLFKSIKQISFGGGSCGVEIGRYFGGSTVLLAVAVGPAGMVSSIDIDPPRDIALKGALICLGLLDRVKCHIGSSTDTRFTPKVGSLDWVLIDGDHSYEGVKADQEFWEPGVREGGLIIHHDMNPPVEGLAKTGPQQLFEQLKRNPGLRLEEVAGSLAVFRKMR